jgi:hypothetical protein
MPVVQTDGNIIWARRARTATRVDAQHAMAASACGGGAQVYEVGQRGERRGQRAGDVVVGQEPAKPNTDTLAVTSAWVWCV